MTQWPHAPLHIFNEKGTYMVTGSTLGRELLFKTPEELDLLDNHLKALALDYKWNLEAWAIFSNHYHFIAQSPEDPSTLKKFVTHFHSITARLLNTQQNTPGRQVWYQYWDTRLTYQNSYLARLNYVMQNPVRHKIVESAETYKWCSTFWFKQNAPKSYIKTVLNFKIDGVKILDDF